MERKEYFSDDDYRRISKDIVRLISQNQVSYRDAKTLMKYVICEMERQMVQDPED